MNSLVQTPEVIETPRLLLRRLKKEDGEEFYRAFVESFDSLTRFYTPAWSKYESVPQKEKIEKFIEREIIKWNEQSCLSFGAVQKESDKFIGQGELHHLDWSVPKGRVGYWVRNGEEGLGYATEIANALTCYAFQALQFERLEIRTEVRNRASAVIAKKLGYEFQAVFCKNKRGKAGEFWDMEIYVRHSLEGLPELPTKF